MTTVFIIIIVFLYGLWYVDNNWQKKERKDLQCQISSLNTEISSLNTEISSLIRRNQALRDTIKAMQQTDNPQ